MTTGYLIAESLWVSPERLCSAKNISILHRLKRRLKRTDRHLELKRRRQKPAVDQCPPHIISRHDCIGGGIKSSAQP